MSVSLDILVENITKDVIRELTNSVKQDKLRSIDLDIQALQQKIKQYNSQKAEINSTTSNNNNGDGSGDTSSTTSNAIEKTQKIQLLNTKIKNAQDKITQLQKKKSAVSVMVVDK